MRACGVVHRSTFSRRSERAVRREWNSLRQDPSECLHISYRREWNAEWRHLQTAFVANPPAASLVEFHRYTLATGLPGPDGIAFGKSGKLYVALQALVRFPCSDPMALKRCDTLVQQQTRAAYPIRCHGPIRLTSLSTKRPARYW